ncbi:DNA replication initiation factor cdc45 [Recurvomyces mirabilis]|uniref:DNA replication initiation factor cdc45 n=1 Tax=Recurvomyces mirabilis TaxID=574656 RepID=A0AAE0WK67_9PEZI|nr:DNA replication initiation factor cdc45 [Recurvomyces mirabilis]KAK5153235.1 DNA replication initiation factor cdc45 [Recurvomyces mirabilis]
MYLPRAQIAQLYTHLLRSIHPSSPPLLVLTALSVDALCGVRILTALLKRDFIPHKVQPVGGYSDLQRVGEEQVQRLRRDNGGEGGVVVCVGCGGGVDLAEMLGLGGEDGVEVWVVDSHRGWNLENVFSVPSNSDGGEDLRRVGVKEGRVLEGYRSGKGGVIVWDEGDVETDLSTEKEAWFALQSMPEITEDDLLAMENGGDAEENDEQAEAGDEDEGLSSSQTRKRKASSQDSDAGSEAGSDDDRPRQRRRSNSSTPIPSSQPTSAQPTFPIEAIPSSPPKQPSQRHLRRQLLKLRRKHETTIERYYDQGTWTGEPVSSIFYSLASELGREDNELLWLAIVGVESVEMSPYTTTGPSAGSGRRTLSRMEQIKSVLRDEVRRLNPVPETDLRRSQHVGEGDIPTSARSPTDTSIRLSPEPRFLLIRHWSLYDSMLHSPYLSTRLHVWNEQGRKRLNKLLAKMGISLAEAGKGYLHLDVEVKRSLRSKVLKFAEQYNLEGLVPANDSGGVGWEGRRGWGFVRSWGWRGTLSAVDVAIVVGAILEVGTSADASGQTLNLGHRDSGAPDQSYSRRAAHLPSPPHSSDSGMADSDTIDSRNASGHDIPDWTTRRFFAAYDALSPTTTTSNNINHTPQGLPALLHQIPLAQSLARAILRTGSALIAKKQIRHLRSFRLGVVKEGPDVSTFTHPGALVKLAAWVSEAVAVLEAEKGVKAKPAEQALVLGALDEGRGVYIVVGLGGGVGGVGGKGFRTKAEQRAREEGKVRKAEERKRKGVRKAEVREERRRLRRERDEANGLLNSDDEDEEHEAQDTESEASSSGSDTGNDSDTDSDSASDNEDPQQISAKRKRGGRNKFGQAFQSVIAETGARVRIDSFEHCVVEVRKEDLSGFLEGLSLKGVVG